MAHPFLDEVQNIIDIGRNSVVVHKQEIQQLKAFASELEAQEKAFYSLINFGGKKISNIRQLNDLIQEIDSMTKIGTLLPKGEIEDKLSKLYILTDTSKRKLSQNETELITATLQKLIDEGMVFINKDIVDSRASATRLSDIKNRLFAALQMGITKNIYISDKRTIVDPITIEPFLSEPQTIDHAKLEIKSNIIRGSQAASDFEAIYTDTRKKTLAKINIKTEGTGKFIPLDKLSDEMAQYLLSIAKDVLQQDYYVIMQKNELTVQTQDGPIPIGSATPEQLKKDVIKIIKETINENIPSSVIDSFASQIAIGRSLSNIRGFLGEMRASLLMYKLFGEKSQYILKSTGLEDKIRMTENGQLQEAPLDFLVKALNTMFGFQVKNTIDTSYTWEGEMSATSFYIQRLQVEMTSGEQNFYGAFSYNQPLDDKDVRGDWADWDLYRRDTYKQFTASFESVFSDVFKSLAPNIIRLSTQTAGGNAGIFQDVGEMTNNFFIMKDKIIAASDIVKALINNENIRASFGMTAGTGRLWKYGDPPTTSYTGDDTRIDYSVTLNYKTLFKSAYNAV